VALSDEQSEAFGTLKRLLESTRTNTRELNAYYEGEHYLEQLGLAIPPELRRFSVFLDWPRTTVDALEMRLDVTGFRMPGKPADQSLWETWQYNNLINGQTEAHTDALALSRSYLCVGTNEVDPEFPRVTVESPMEMIAVRDPRTRRVEGALRLYGGDDSSAYPVSTTAVTSIDNRATLYMPNETRWLILQDGSWVDEFDPDVHKLGTVPIVPMANRRRATRRTGALAEGVSEMATVIPIAESASRAITNAQLAQEVLAAPGRAVLGATKGDFVDEDGNVLSAWQSYFGAIWAIANPDAKVQQFDAADLGNFEKIIGTYARLASGQTFMPIEYFGLNTQNPPSADGQRAGETRLIKKAERRQSTFGQDWADVQRIVLRFRDGEWDTEARRIETMWRDAGTPTIAQVTDAVSKQYADGLIDWETAQEQLGRSPETIETMKKRRAADTAAALGFGAQAAANAQ
jgi:hypothetical protein